MPVSILDGCDFTDMGLIVLIVDYKSCTYDILTMDDELKYGQEYFDNSYKF